MSSGGLAVFEAGVEFDLVLKRHPRQVRYDCRNENRHNPVEVLSDAVNASGWLG